MAGLNLNNDTWSRCVALEKHCNITRRFYSYIKTPKEAERDQNVSDLQCSRSMSHCLIYNFRVELCFKLWQPYDNYFVSRVVADISMITTCCTVHERVHQSCKLNLLSVHYAFLTRHKAFHGVHFLRMKIFA